MNENELFAYVEQETMNVVTPDGSYQTKAPGFTSLKVEGHGWLTTVVLDLRTGEVIGTHTKSTEEV